MPTPIQYIEVRAPSYAAEPDINDFIEQAELEVGNYYCGNEDFRNKAVALLTCHWKALYKRSEDGTATGSLVSEKEGDLSRKYSDVSGDINDEYLAQTAWGLELIALQKQTMVLPRNRFTT